MKRTAFHPRACPICDCQLDAAQRVYFVDMVNVLRRASGYTEERATLIACQLLHPHKHHTTSTH